MRPDPVDALIGVAPMVGRLIERLLANTEPTLTPAQFLAMRAITEGVSSGTQLARAAGVSGPAISQLVAGLVDSGLVLRDPAPDDRRRQILSLSPAGAETLSQVNDALRTVIGPLLEGIPRPELDALGRALPHLQAHLSGVTPPRRPGPPAPPRPPGSPLPPPHHGAR